MTNENTIEPLELDESENETKETITHTVRHRDGGTVTIERYSRTKAIKLWCSECMGFEEDVLECTDKKCPFFPFKRRTTLNRIRDKNTTTETEKAG